MNLHLDTHTLIWFLTDDQQLPLQTKKHIQNINNNCFVSIASLWEITIKISLSKLQMKLSLAELFDELSKNQLKTLPIDESHLIILSKIQFHHRDPFDRLLIAQAICENLKLVSKDTFFSAYNIDLLWN